MYLSIDTVKGYTKSFCRKLDVATRAEAVRNGQESSVSSDVSDPAPWVDSQPGWCGSTLVRPNLST
jgi:hypothetical protein